MGTGGQKHAMLTKYNQSKQKRVLDWIVTMKKETEHVASTTSGSTESWMNSHEILKLISFDATALSENKAAHLLKDLLREAEVLPGEPCQVLEHDSPSLTNWCYKKPNANVRTEQDVERLCKRETLSGAGGTMDMVQDTGVGIKTESSDMKAVQEKTIVLKSSKTTITRLLEQARDLQALVSVRSADTHEVRGDQRCNGQHSNGEDGRRRVISSQDDREK